MFYSSHLNLLSKESKWNIYVITVPVKTLIQPNFNYKIYSIVVFYRSEFLFCLTGCVTSRSDVRNPPPTIITLREAPSSQGRYTIY